jgi:ppGpp synthetase/RelA/SpoT-type nucleotidyltranferase
LVTSLLAQSNAFDELPVVTARVKDENESIAKFQRKYQTDLEQSKTPYEIKSHITDLIGLRVTCLYETDIPAVAEVLKSNFDVIAVTDKISALESTEDSFGYKGLHFDLSLNEQRRTLAEYARYRDLRFEVQVRTTIQDAWANLDHKIKYKKAIPPSLKRRVNVLAALFELADHEFLAIRNETQALLTRPSADVGASIADQPPLLDVFHFLERVQPRYPEYSFDSTKVDGFVQDILSMNPGMSSMDFASILDVNLPVVAQFAKWIFQMQGRWLNPFTEMRHALYLHDRKTFERSLYDLQRRSFDVWLESHVAQAPAAEPPRLPIGTA